MVGWVSLPLFIYFFKKVRAVKLGDSEWLLQCHLAGSKATHFISLCPVASIYPGIMLGHCHSHWHPFPPNCYIVPSGLWHSTPDFIMFCANLLGLHEDSPCLPSCPCATGEWWLPSLSLPTLGWGWSTSDTLYGCLYPQHGMEKWEKRSRSSLGEKSTWEGWLKEHPGPGGVPSEAAKPLAVLW